MATRFAVASTPWNTPSTWDNGAVPVAGDTVYPNGFTVPIDIDISVASLNNNVSNVYLPNMAIPAMTGNTLPEGICFANINLGLAWQAFDQNSSTSWSTNASPTNLGYIGYKFSSGKLIRRYYFTGTSYGITSFKFQGSFDDITYADLDIVNTGSYQTYTSPLLSNTNAYTYYRLNILATGLGNAAIIQRLDMTESTAPTYGGTPGGSFTVPSSLSGTRDIEFTGDGIITGGTNATNTVITVAALSGNIVNFNKTAGAYIVNRFYRTSSITSYTAPVINITGTAAVNFNGDLWGCQTANNTAAYGGVVGINAASTVTVNGNIYADKGTDGAPTYYAAVLQMNAANCVVNVIGQVFSSDFKAYGSPIVSTATVSTLNITGNLNIQLGTVVYITGTCYLTLVGTINYLNASSWKGIWYTAAANSTLSITGAITSAPNYSAVDCVGAITITIPTGTITAGTGAVAISAPSATLVTTGVSPLINNNNYMAVYAPKIRFYTGAQVEWTFQTSTGGTKILRNADGSSGLPSFTNVKIGQPFGPNRDIIGACVIPPANTVGVGIPVSTITLKDTPVPVTVGTSQLTGEDLLTAISTSSNVVAQRIKNLATVETTGDQLAAFNRI